MQEQQTQLTVPDDLMDIVRRIAARTGRPESSILREAVETYMRNWERPVFRSLGVGSDTEVSSTTVKDWLQQNFRP